jgi:AcrR family transcriptional regulator
MMQAARKERLGEDAWVRAGLRALAREGIDAVRVERLAQDLKVTKGSFYWHFKNRAALLARLLDAWRRAATGAVIDEVEAQGGDAAAKLRTLFTIVFSADGRLDRAVRAWAAQDAVAAAAVAGIDRRRLAYVAAQLHATGLSKAESKARARFAYFALIGQFTVMAGMDKSLRMSDYLGAIVPMLLAKPAPPRTNKR